MQNRLREVDFNAPEDARGFVIQHFKDSPTRLQHILAVADNVKESAVKLSDRFDIDPDRAYCAALLHDIGYLPEIASSGFHPWDGYKFLVSRGYNELAELIVCHSNSPEQAEMLGLEAIVVSDDPIAGLITYWDLQIMQGGEKVSYTQRMSDIAGRYEEGSPTLKAHRLAEPRLRKILQEFDGLLGRNSF